MTEYSNVNTGALFKNDKKDTANHPAYKGSVNVDGTDYWLSAWLKTSKQGTKFMSLSVSPKEGRQEAPRQAKAAPAGFDDDCDIPF